MVFVLMDFDDVFFVLWGLGGVNGFFIVLVIEVIVNFRLIKLFNCEDIEDNKLNFYIFLIDFDDLGEFCMIFESDRMI